MDDQKIEAGSCVVYIDGASRGNPGPSAYAYVLITCSGEKYVESSRIGTSTNNKAEYTALIRALSRAKSVGCRRLTVYSDSQLLTRQLNGEYRVRDPGLRALYQEAMSLMASFEAVRIIHIPRERNLEADALANAELKKTVKDGPSER